MTKEKMNSKNNIHFNFELYKILKQELLNDKYCRNDEHLISYLNRASRLAEISAIYYNGLLSDHFLEKSVISFFKTSNFYKKQKQKIEKVGKWNENNVIHYTTSVFKIGGHSRMIKNWIECDEKNYLIYISNQNTEIPLFLKNCNIIYRKKGNILNDIQSFIDVIIKFKAGYIICYNFCNDWITTLAKEILKNDEIKFIYYNHEDFLFTIGSYNADICIDFLSTQHKINRKYRYNDTNSYYLPLKTKNNNISSKIINKKINIVTIAGKWRLTSNSAWNMASVIDKLKNSNIPFDFHFIGITKKEASLIYPNITFENNIVFHGSLENIDKILLDCHIYIESIPIGSGLATNEAIAFGCYPILNTSPLFFYETSPMINSFPIKLIEENKNCTDLISYSNYVIKIMESIWQQKKTDTFNWTKIIIENNKYFEKNIGNIYKTVAIANCNYPIKVTKVNNRLISNYVDNKSLNSEYYIKILKLINSFRTITKIRVALLFMIRFTLDKNFMMLKIIIKYFWGLTVYKIKSSITTNKH
jgi:hypothetical protein